MKKWSIRDSVIVVLTIVFIAILVIILLSSQGNDKDSNNEIQDYSAGLDNNAGEIIHTTSIDALVIYKVHQDGIVEIYNGKKTPVELDGMKILLNGRIIYTCGSESIASKDISSVDTKTKISNEKDSILALADKEGNEIFHMIVPTMEIGQSYGYIKTDSYEVGITDESLEEGKGVVKKSENEIEFSVKSGFYSKSFSLELSAPSGTKIYYTLDGTDPTIESEEYVAPIKILNKSGSNYTCGKLVENGYKPSSVNMGTSVRAIAVNEQNQIVDTKVQNYFVGIQDSSAYFDVPIISITINPEYLFDYFEGIYVSGRSYADAMISEQGDDYVGNYLKLWKKKAYIEYFEKDKTKTFEGNLDINVYIDSNVKNSQKSFFITGDSKAPEGSSLHSYFTNGDKGVLLSTGGMDYVCKIRQMLAKELVKGTMTNIQNMEPCALFINGEYWGSYLMNGEFSNSYFQTEYNVSSAEVLGWDWQTANYAPRDEFNSFVRYVVMNDMSNPVEYANACSQMDIQSYIDYVCVNMYLANAEYVPTSHATVWRSNDEQNETYGDNRWRWLINNVSYTTNLVGTKKKTATTIDTYLLPNVSKDLLLQSFLMNEDFCDQLKITMSKMNQNVFTQERVAAFFEQYGDVLRNQAEASYKRYIGESTNDVYSSEVNKIEEFFENRYEYISLYTDEIISQKGNLEELTEARISGDIGLNIEETIEE